MASGGDDGAVLLWDSVDPMQTLGKHSEVVLCMCGGGNGPSHFWRGSENYLFSGSQDKLIKLWDLSNNSLVLHFVTLLLVFYIKFGNVGS